MPKSSISSMTPLTNLLQPVRRTRHVFHYRALGDFQRQMLRRQPAVAQGVGDVVEQLVLRNWIGEILTAMHSAGWLAAPARPASGGRRRTVPSARCWRSPTRPAMSTNRSGRAGPARGAASGSAPGADEAPAAVDLRLVVQHELLARQRFAQRTLHGRHFMRPGVHVGGEELVVPPGLLGVVHRHVGVARQRLAIRPSWPDGDADRAGDVDRCAPSMPTGVAISAITASATRMQSCMAPMLVSRITNCRRRSVPACPSCARSGAGGRQSRSAARRRRNGRRCR